MSNFLSYSGTQRLPRLVGLTKALEMILVYGKAPYRPVHTGPAADRYADPPLSGASIEEEKGKRRSTSPSPARRRRSCVARGRLLSPRREKKRLPTLGVRPRRFADLVGFGVAVATGMQYLQSFPERVYKSMLMSIMIEDKRTVGIHLWFHSVTGEATRMGFYKYDNKRKASPDPELMKYIEKSRNMAGVTPNPEVLSPLLMKLPDKDIVEMVFFPVVNEACRVLDEGIAVKASDLDIASIMGMGFPPY
ncbi:hypothetical protein GW17_00036984, partial [Ensete ventricosum]